MHFKWRHSHSFIIFPKAASTMVMTLTVQPFPTYFSRWRKQPHAMLLTLVLCTLRQTIPDSCASRNDPQCYWHWFFARCIKPFRITARFNIICLASDFFPRWVKIKTRHEPSWTECNHACLSTLDQQCVQPKQQRKLAQGIYTLACWIASQISSKAGLFQGETLPSSTTGTQR